MVMSHYPGLNRVTESEEQLQVTGFRGLKEVVTVTEGTVETKRQTEREGFRI